MQSENKKTKKRKSKNSVWKDESFQKKGGEPVEVYVCEVCGYRYDPAAGDPDNGIAPGTKFEDIPEDWVCPICSVGKDQFAKE